MKEIYKLYKIDPWENFKNFSKFFELLGEDFDHDQILPLSFKTKFEEALEISHKNLIELDKDFNYNEKFSNHTSLFNSLQRSKIDGLLLLALKEIEKNESILSSLNSFNPKSSYASKVIYNRTNTVTGRLTVKSGPRILTLPSRCRHIIKSRFDKGNIYMVDFKSLEPRIARYVTGNSCSKDVYNDISDSLDLEVDRSVIKRAVISVLYGAKNKLIDSLSREKVILLFKKINEYFNMEKLKKISHKKDDFGFRRNYFGRPLYNSDVEKENVIINNFIQSTAVDISLDYFYKLTCELDCKYAIPLFIIHDAIIFDVSEEYRNSFLEKIDAGYENNLGKFYLETQEISRRTK